MFFYPMRLSSGFSYYDLLPGRLDFFSLIVTLTMGGFPPANWMSEGKIRRTPNVVEDATFFKSIASVLIRMPF
jgi:hypothetical protein